MAGVSKSMSAVVETEVEEITKEPQTRRLPPYNVVILNDEDHTFDYVIELLIKLFRHTLPKAKELTERIHTTGARDRLHDPQGTGRAEARPGDRLRPGPAEPVIQGPAPLLCRAGTHGLRHSRFQDQSSLNASGSPLVMSG